MDKQTSLSLFLANDFELSQRQGGKVGWMLGSGRKQARECMIKEVIVAGLAGEQVDVKLINNIFSSDSFPTLVECLILFKDLHSVSMKENSN